MPSFISLSPLSGILSIFSEDPSDFGIYFVEIEAIDQNLGTSGLNMFYINVTKCPESASIISVS